MNMPKVYPSKCTLIIELPEGTGSIKVPEDLFDVVIKGNSLKVVFTHGWLSGSVYIKKIFK